MRDLVDLLVHFQKRNTNLGHVYLSMPHSLCLMCKEEISDSYSYLQYRVCPTCRFHYSLTARERIELLADTATFRETNRSVASLDPLTFSRGVKDSSRITQDQKRTGLTEAAVTGHCSIGGVKTEIVVLDFGFMGGTMGSVVGEKVALAFEGGAKANRPALAIVTGGGIRAQEGVISLMQMAKTVTATHRLRDKGLPLIVVLANPSTGQAYASFANLADIILAETGALIGLAPMRTLREATKKPIPLDAHTAEAHLHHGLLDDVVDREDLKDKLVTLLSILAPQKTGLSPNVYVSNTTLPKPVQTNGDPVGLDINDVEKVARHPDRPAARDYIRSLIDHFVELKGDRISGDDRTLVAGVGFLRGQRVAIVGQQQEGQRGHENYHIYPVGFRKAQRLITLASCFKLPVLALIDTQGAHPGLESEEQGIGNAIATTLSLMADAPTPIISVIIGEGGSEGALALSLADTVFMQKYSLVAPISLPSASARLHRNPTGTKDAAQALMLTSYECKELGIVDQIVHEPDGGAHTDPLGASHLLQIALAQELARLVKLSSKKLVDNRRKKFRRMGELTVYAKEALGREISLLEHIAAREHASRTSRPSQRKSGDEKGSAPS